MRRLSLFSIALLLALGCLAPEQAAAQATVFEGARVIVGDGSQPIENAAFVIENGRFTAVGRRGQVNAPAGARRVDLTGKTVMPAIIDTHKHLAQNREELVGQLERFAYYGVGVAMSLGQDTGDAPFQVRAETIPNAARFHTAGRGITAPEPGRTTAPYWVRTDAEARNAIRELAAKRVDWVKLWVDDRNGTVTKLGPELYRAAIDEAHKNNLRVTAHVYYLEDGKGLLRAGLDSFAHGIRDKDIDDEFVQLFKQRNVILAPNLPNRGVRLDYAWLAPSLPADEFQRLETENRDNPQAQQFFGIQARNLARLNREGVKIALGTDGPIPWAAHYEMEDMVAAGMTPAQVLVAATRNGADLLRMTDVGTVAAGKSADFIVLDANPLDDIKNTRRISTVYLRGAEVNRPGLRARWTSGTAR